MQMPTNTHPHEEEISVPLPEKATALLANENAKAVFTLMSYYKCAMLEVETKFRVLNEEFSHHFDRNPISHVQTRIKDFPAICDKLRRKGLPLTLGAMHEHLNDIAGVRVICPFIDDIYTLAKCLLQQDDITLLEIKDYITQPKPNGYRSLHLIIQIPIYLQAGKKNMKVEIQLRTLSMDCWASLEHQLRYKKDFGNDENTAKELLRCAELCAELDERMDNMRQTVLSSVNEFGGDD